MKSTKQLSGLPKIQRAQTLDELAYLHIKRAIITGVFEPGEFLPEIQVAQDLGISKTPVRKALGRLQQERFLVNIPFEGHYVAEISIEDILEIYQLRQILECYLIRQTVGEFCDAELDQLEAILQEASVSLAEDDQVRFVDLNREFHHAFDRKHANQRISAVLTNLDEHVQRILHHEIKGHEEELGTSHREHYMILNAVREQDPDSAAHLMHQHLARFCDTLVSHWTSNQQAGPASIPTQANEA